MISSPDDRPVTIYANQIIATGFLQLETEGYVRTINQNARANNDKDPKYKVELSQACIDNEQKKKLEELIEEFSDVFAINQYDLGSTKVKPVEIKTTSDVPVHCKPHRIPFQFKKEFEEHIQRLVKPGAMVESRTPWVST